MAVFDYPPEVLSPQVLASFDDEALWQVIYGNLHPGKDAPGAWAALLAAKVADRVRRPLTAHQVDIEHQLAGRVPSSRSSATSAGRQARPEGRRGSTGRPNTTVGATARSGSSGPSPTGSRQPRRPPVAKGSGSSRSAAPTGTPPVGWRSRSTGTGRPVSKRASTQSRTTKPCGRSYGRSACRTAARWSPPPTCSPTACGRERSACGCCWTSTSSPPGPCYGRADGR